MGNEKKKKKTGEPQRYSWGTRRTRRRQVNPRDISGEREEEEDR